MWKTLYSKRGSESWLCPLGPSPSWLTSWTLLHEWAQKDEQNFLTSPQNCQKQTLDRSVYSSWQQTYSWWCGFWNPAHGNKKTWNPLAHGIIIRPRPNNEQCFSYFLTKRFQESYLLGALAGLPAVSVTLEFCKNYHCNKGNSTQAEPPDL